VLEPKEKKACEGEGEGGKEGGREGRMILHIFSFLFHFLRPFSPSSSSSASSIFSNTLRVSNGVEDGREFPRGRNIGLDGMRGAHGIEVHRPRHVIRQKLIPVVKLLTEEEGGDECKYSEE